MNQANLIATSQLEIKALLTEAIYLHYGFVQNPAGQWTKKEGSRNMPSTLNAVRIKRHDLFARKHFGTNKVLKFFDTVINGSNKFLSNQYETNLPAEKFGILAGLCLRESAGASGAAVDALDFDSIAITNVENGLITLKVNDVIEIDKQPIKQLLDNTDGIKDFIRFPRLIVWEPNNKIELEIETNANVGDYWYEPTLKGFILEK